METTHLAPLHCLDPSLPLRGLGRRYLLLLNNERKARTITRFLFLAAGLKIVK